MGFEAEAAELEKAATNSKRKLMKFNVRLTSLKLLTRNPSMLNWLLAPSSVALPCWKKKLLETRLNFKKILKNVTKPKLHAPRMKKEDVPVKPDPLLLNNLLKQWKLNLKKLNKLQLQPITSSKTPPVNAKLSKVTLNASLKELKNSNQKHVTLKHK